jgi:hypothetical protein
MSAKDNAPVPVSTARIRAVAVRDIIARSKPEDYDGHTEFERLSPSDRLDWLDAAVTFIEESQRNLKGAATGSVK